MIVRLLFMFSLVLVLCTGLQAQTDSTVTKNMGDRRSGNISKTPIAPLSSSKPDTLKKSTVAPNVHSPKKAALYSALLPGAGQIYNRKYWKVGLLAAGTGALIYSLQFNQRNYTLFKSELIKRQQGLTDQNTDLVKYSDANLNELQDFYHRNRDLTIAGMALLYAMNIIDATVDAHFFDFNINDDLSLRVRPEPVYSSLTTFPVAGLGLTLHF